MERKSFQGYLTKIDDDLGIVEAIVAVMGNIDLGKDIIHPGAFTKTLSERGGKVRVLDSHKNDSIMRAIGKPVEIREIGISELPAELLAQYPDATGGLWARTQFLMDEPEGKGAYSRLKAGIIAEWSIGYDTVKGGTDYSKVNQNGNEITVRNLREIKLYEYSPVLWGMNEGTTTLVAKTSADAAPQATAKEMTDRGPVQRLGDVLQGSIHQVFTSLTDSWLIEGVLDRDERIALSGLIGNALDVLSSGIPDDIAQREVWGYYLMSKTAQLDKEVAPEDVPEAEKQPVQAGPFETPTALLQLVEIEELELEMMR